MYSKVPHSRNGKIKQMIKKHMSQDRTEKGLCPHRYDYKHSESALKQGYLYRVFHSCHNCRR